MSEEEFLKARQYTKASRVQVGRETAFIPEPPRFIYTYETVKRGYPVGLPPPSAVATKLGIMEYQLAMEHEKEPQYVTVTEQTRHALGQPPPKALAQKLMQMELGILENQAPKGTYTESLEKTPEGYQITYIKPQPPEHALTDVWLQGVTAEDILSQLVLRNLWDPEYKKRWRESREQFEKSHDIPTIQRQQTEQATIAATVAIIGYAAFDIGRSLYTIAKWKLATRKPVFIPEQEEKPFTYVRVSGVKGARIAEQFSYKPQGPKPETFTVKMTRGTTTTPMKVTLEKLLKSKEASTTLPELLLWPSERLEIKVPLGMYEPRFFTETMLSSISLGSLQQVTQGAPSEKQIQKLHSVVRLEQPERLFQRQKQGLVMPQIQRLNVAQRQKQQFALIVRLGQQQRSGQRLQQQQSLAISQLLGMRQSQVQKQLEKSRFNPLRINLDSFLPKPKKREKGGKWWLKHHPIPTPETVLKRHGRKRTSKLEHFIY